MLKKLSIAALIILIASCSSKSKNSNIVDQAQPQDNFRIDDQIVEEESYQTLASEDHAKNINEGQIVQEVEVQDRVFFGYNSATISGDAQKVLDTQIEWLKSSPEIKITIEGHCDERGTREYNIALGEKRAVSTKNYLVSGGVSSSRIQVISYGKERPAYVGSSEDIYSKNRRAVVVVN